MSPIMLIKGAASGGGKLGLNNARKMSPFMASQGLRVALFLNGKLTGLKKGLTSWAMGGGRWAGQLTARA